MLLKPSEHRQRDTVITSQEFTGVPLGPGSWHPEQTTEQDRRGWQAGRRFIKSQRKHSGRTEEPSCEVTKGHIYTVELVFIRLSLLLWVDLGSMGSLRDSST